MCACATCCFHSKQQLPAHPPSKRKGWRSRSCDGVKRGSDFFAHGSQRSHTKKEKEGGVEMRGIGAGEWRWRERGESIQLWALPEWESTRCLLAMKFEECHSAPTHLKTMRRSTHDCKQIKLSDQENNSLTCARLHSGFWLRWISRDENKESEIWAFQWEKSCKNLQQGIP